MTIIHDATNPDAPAVKFEVRTIPTIIKGPFVKWYRNPIWWWKMRHLRADIKVMEEAVDPEFRQKLNELEDEVFLNGTGN